MNLLKFTGLFDIYWLRICVAIAMAVQFVTLAYIYNDLSAGGGSPYMNMGPFDTFIVTVSIATIALLALIWLWNIRDMQALDTAWTTICSWELQAHECAEAVGQNVPFIVTEQPMPHQPGLMMMVIIDDETMADLVEMGAVIKEVGTDDE